MAWIKISESDGGTFAQEASPDPRKIVTIDELQAQIDELKATPEPSDEELIEEGKAMHPYYMDTEMQIENLQAQIDNLLGE